MSQQPPKEDPSNNPRPEKQGPEKQGWFAKLKTTFNSVSRKDAGKVVKATLKDLRRPKEIGILLVASFMPGGWVGYAAYRVAKFKLQAEVPPPGNDNTPLAGPAPENKTDAKKAKPPKPPKP